MDYQPTVFKELIKAAFFSLSVINRKGMSQYVR